MRRSRHVDSAPYAYTIKGRLLKLSVCKNYNNVNLFGADGTKKSFDVHLLVARAFLPKPSADKPWVLHRDDDGHNNYYRNLRWGTPKENAGDRIRNGGQVRGERQGSAVLTSTDILRIREQLLLGVTCKDLANAFGTAPQTISRIKRGETWAHVEAAQ